MSTRRLGVHAPARLAAYESLRWARYASRHGPQGVSLPPDLTPLLTASDRRSTKGVDEDRKSPATFGAPSDGLNDYTGEFDPVRYRVRLALRALELLAGRRIQKHPGAMRCLTAISR